MNKTSYLLVRLAIGISMLGHGLVRLPKLAAFSQGMTAPFMKSMLPMGLVIPFSYALPFLEFGVGLFVVTGMFFRAACIAGAVVMIMLIFGTAMIENWEAIPSQLIHVAFFAILINYPGSNSYALDQSMQKSGR